MASEVRLPRQKFGRTAGANPAVEREEVGYEEGTRVTSGKLAHAEQVVPPGKTFMRRLFEYLTAMRRVTGKVR